MHDSQHPRDACQEVAVVCERRIIWAAHLANSTATSVAQARIAGDLENGNPWGRQLTADLRDYGKTWESITTRPTSLIIQELRNERDGRLKGKTTRLTRPRTASQQEMDQKRRMRIEAQKEAERSKKKKSENEKEDED